MTNPFGLGDDFSSMFGGASRVPELERKIEALTKECDRLRSLLVEAEARASRLAKLHQARGA